MNPSLLVGFIDLSPVDPLLLIVLYLGACLGHAVLMVSGLNCLYGCALPHKLLSVTRKLDFLLVLAGPVLFWLAFGLRIGLPLESTATTVQSPFVSAYLVVCWFLGFGVFPVVTVLRLLRRTPAAVLSTKTQLVNVAAELGYKPMGRSKHSRLAHLPGNQIFQVDFVERTFKLPRLPAAWEGLRILHLTDLHLCGCPDRAFHQYVMDRCKAWEPDIVAVTGDVVDSAWHHRWVLPVLGRLRWNVGAFAILGNHDSWRDVAVIRRRLKRVGMDVLDNAWRQLEVRGEPLVVVGHEGPWFAPEPDLSGCPEGPFRLCLSHTPDNIKWARRNRMDLMLAGHVHGGQIRFPIVGSVLVPSRYSRKYDCGTFDEPPTLMHVSRGLAGQHPLRYNCRPEVTLLVLRQ